VPASQLEWACCAGPVRGCAVRQWSPLNLEPAGCCQPVMKSPSRSWKPAAFMQYAACMHDEGIWHTACKNSGANVPASQVPLASLSLSLSLSLSRARARSGLAYAVAD
jgi:hypothetical protein